MTDPQVWTLIGVFSAVMFAALGVSTRYTVSTLRAEMRAGDARLGGRIDALEGRMVGGFEGVAARFDAVEKRLDARCDALDTKIDGKYDHLAEVFGVRLDSVDHRLSAVEDDLKIVKAHLLRHPAA